MLYEIASTTLAARRRVEGGVRACRPPREAAGRRFSIVVVAEGARPKDGTVEAWARSQTNPLGGWYGLRKGYRGRAGMYLPPLLEELGLAEVEHQPRNNRMRAR